MNPEQANKEIEENGDLKITAKKFCELTEFSLRTYQQMVGRGILPAPVDGVVPLFKAVSALLMEYRSKGEDSKLKKDYLKQRTENAKLLNKLKTFELEESQGELLHKSKVVESLKEEISNVKSQFLNFSKILPLQLQGRDVKEITQILDSECRNLLEKLSSYPDKL